MKVTKKHLLSALILLGLVYAAVIGAYIAFFYVHRDLPLSPSTSTWGEFGDYVGGILNPLFAFMAFMGVLLTVHLQSRQLQDLQEHNVRQSRAYLMIHLVDLRLDKESMSLEVVLTFRNYGQTPAYDVTQWSGLHLLPYPPPPIPEVTPAEIGHRSKRDVGPGGEFLQIRSLQLTGAELVAIKSKTQALYMRGEVSYLDAFKTARRTRFKMIWGGPQATLLPSLAACDDGNEAT